MRFILHFSSVVRERSGQYVKRNLPALGRQERRKVAFILVL